MATASELFEARHYPGVVALITDALEAEPECVPLLLVRARAQIALRRDLDAQADLRDIIRLDPQCSLAYRLLGELAARRDENESAAIFFREALRLDPGDREAEDWLAIVQCTSRPAAVAQKLPAPAAAAGRFPPARGPVARARTANDGQPRSIGSPSRSPRPGSQPRFAKGTWSPEDERPTARRVSVSSEHAPAVSGSIDRRIERPIGPSRPSRPIERPIERPVAHSIERPIERPVAHSIERPIERPVAHSIEHPFERPVAHSIERPIERPVAHSIERPIERPVAHSIEHPFERPVAHSSERRVAHSSERPVERAVARFGPDIETDKDIPALPPPPVRVATGSSPTLHQYVDPPAHPTLAPSVAVVPSCSNHAIALRVPVVRAPSVREPAFREPEQPATFREPMARVDSENETYQGAQPVRRPLTQQPAYRPGAQPMMRGPMPELPGFGEYLVSTGILTRERLRAAQAYQRSMKVQLSTAIVTLGLATPQRIEWAAVAHQSQLARGG